MRPGGLGRALSSLPAAWAVLWPWPWRRGSKAVGRLRAKPHEPRTPVHLLSVRGPYWVLGTSPFPGAGAPGCPQWASGHAWPFIPSCLTPPNAVALSPLLSPVKGRPSPPTGAQGWPHLFAGGGQLVGLRGQQHQVVDDALQVGDLSQHGQLAVLRKQRVRAAGPARLPALPALPGLREAGRAQPGLV